jgi:hypothetical protein
VKVSFKDRFQDKLYSSLNDAILDGGNSELAGLAVPLGNLYPSVLGRSVGPSEKLFLYALKKLLHSLGLDVFKAHSIQTRRSIVGLGLSIRHF